MEDVVNKEFKRYSVYFIEKSDGPQCNGGTLKILESLVFPTIQLLKKNYYFSPGSCTNVTYPGCEDCGGSVISYFHAEEYSIDGFSRLLAKGKLENCSNFYPDEKIHRIDNY